MRSSEVPGKMSEPTPVLPDVLTQIRALPSSDRPLVICDVDEVILHFIRHLEVFLDAREMVFQNHQYRLTGNISRRGSLEPVGAADVRRHIQEFFDDAAGRQELVQGADVALGELSGSWDVVLLTNLPGSHNKPAREQLLAKFGIPFPVVCNSGPKGGAVAALAAGRPRPVVFIDDSPTNHGSVHASLPSCSQIQFVADPRFLAQVTPEAHIDLLTGDWQETSAYINAIL